MDDGFGTRVALRVGLKRTPGPLRRFKISAGESPPSPGRQGMSWERPSWFQARGTGRLKLNPTQRLAHRIGRLTWPRLLPEVRVERVAPELFTIYAKPAGELARRVSLVSVALEEVRDDGTRIGLASYSVRTGNPSPPLWIPHEGVVHWRAAGYNFLRQRGEPAPEKVAMPPPWPLEIGGRSNDDQGARRVFEGALTGYLRRRGAAATNELLGDLGWFWLRLNRTEVERVIDASRGDDYVAPLGQAKDAAGIGLFRDEWALTDRGRQLERTRALSLRDSIVAIRGVGKPVFSAAETWGKRVTAVLAPFLPFLALPIGASVSIAVVAAGAVLALGLSASLRGETELRRAAEHWPRLRTCRPKIYTWQTTAWRPWERVPIAIVAAAYLVTSAIVLRWTGAWKFDVWSAIAFGVGIAALSWVRLGDAWSRWRRLNKEFRDERDRVKRLRSLDPDHPCVWGHACDAAEQGATASCRRFGPDAPVEADRVPSAA